MISPSALMCRYSAYLGPCRGWTGSSSDLQEMISHAMERNAWYIRDISTLGDGMIPWKNVLLDLEQVNMEGIA